MATLLLCMPLPLPLPFLELLDPLGEFRRMFRRERCVMLLHLAAPAGEHGGEAEAAYNESEAETASLLVFVAKQKS